MTESQHDSVETLDQELTKLEDEWNRILTEFVGPAPQIPVEPAEWDEATELNYILGPTEDKSFPFAHSKTVRKVRVFFDARFTPWAARMVAEFGADRFESFGIPDPSPRGLPLNSRGYETEVAWLTGTANTSHAGLRIIFWAAASAKPAALHRSREFGQYTFSLWLSDLVQFFPAEITGPVGNDSEESISVTQPGGWCRAERDLIDWVRQGIDLLLAPRADQSVAVPSTTAPPTGKYLMRKLSKRTIVVIFGDETGAIDGIAAFSLQRLIVEQSVDVFELGGDTQVAQSRRSILASSVTAELAIADDRPRPGSAWALRRQELEPLKAQMVDFKKDLAIAISDNEREEAEKNIELLGSQIRETSERFQSRWANPKQRVDKGFERLRRKILDKMPRFQQHLENAIKFDKESGQFCYQPEQSLDWTFEGF